MNCPSIIQWCTLQDNGISYKTGYHSDLLGIIYMGTAGNSIIFWVCNFVPGLPHDIFSVNIRNHLILMRTYLWYRYSNQSFSGTSVLTLSKSSIVKGKYTTYIKCYLFGMPFLLFNVALAVMICHQWIGKCWHKVYLVNENELRPTVYC